VDTRFRDRFITLWEKYFGRAVRRRLKGNRLVKTGSSHSERSEESHTDLRFPALRVRFFTPLRSVQNDAIDGLSRN